MDKDEETKTTDTKDDKTTDTKDDKSNALLSELEKLKAELSAQKKAAEDAKLTEEERVKKQFEDEKAELEKARKELHLDRNKVLAKSVLLSEKIKLNESYLPFLNITHESTEEQIAKSATNLRALIDTEVKKALEGKGAAFNAGGQKNTDSAEYGKMLATKGRAEIKDNPYFKV